MAKTYDPKCLELAKHFLPAPDDFAKWPAEQLAIAIQEAVEDWLSDEEDEPQQAVFEDDPTDLRGPGPVNLAGEAVVPLCSGNDGRDAIYRAWGPFSYTGRTA